MDCYTCTIYKYTNMCIYLNVCIYLDKSQRSRAIQSGPENPAENSVFSYDKTKIALVQICPHSINSVGGGSHKHCFDALRWWKWPPLQRIKKL